MHLSYIDSRCEVWVAQGNRRCRRTLSLILIYTIYYSIPCFCMSRLNRVCRRRPGNVEEIKYFYGIPCYSTLLYSFVLGVLTVVSQYSVPSWCHRAAAVPPCLIMLIVSRWLSLGLTSWPRCPLPIIPKWLRMNWLSCYQPGAMRDSLYYRWRKKSISFTNTCSLLHPFIQLFIHLFYFLLFFSFSHPLPSPRSFSLRLSILLWEIKS